MYICILMHAGRREKIFSLQGYVILTVVGINVYVCIYVGVYFRSLYALLPRAMAQGHATNRQRKMQKTVKVTGNTAKLSRQ